MISTHDTDLAYEWANEAWVLGMDESRPKVLSAK